ncbi:hypothetical protein M3Y94_00831800 [Aphelenchoides besseyi]|nr:hypothetical protein M3Y94_00831800 [Aphelenchoides besseyi]
MIFSVKHFEFFAFISLIYHLADARHLWLNTGIIEGRTVSVWPHEVDVYKGIPFAEKPVGNRRFQLPEPKRPWHGILNTTEYSRPCISNTTQTTSPQSNVSEDCLYLNVFADARCQSRLCPILFYIHGGDFYYDSAVMFNDTEIINKYASDEIIFVIPAYRMGIFGFLDLGKELDSTAYNIGFYDILLALRWVQQEGLNFGGDVNRITIVGNSGGAMAVQYLLVSPAVESGAFQQAVMLSGVAGLRPHANRKLTEIVTSAVKCDQDNNGTLLEIDEQLSCLRSTSARALTIATKESEAEWISISPQTDPVLFPAKDMATLLEERLKSMPMLITTTPDEMVLETRNRTNFEMCLSFFSSFGYEMNETANACSKFYEKRDPDAMTKDALHSFAMKVAIANRQRGQQSYVGVFSQLNHTHHANDMTYFFWSPSDCQYDRKR